MPQVPQAVFVSEGDTVPYTPSSAVTEGDVVAMGFANIGIAERPIEANVKGTLRMRGLFWMKKATGAISRFDEVHWSSSGNPVSGTAGTGAINNSGTGTYAGIAVLAALSGDAEVLVYKMPNGEGLS